jgi:hypothetical protein
MIDRPQPSKTGAKRPPMPRALSYWYGLMAVGGLAFGLIGERRPLGGDVLAHPAVLFFIAVGVGLLALRAVLSRPVPEVIPERALLFGCFIGLGGFLAGNWIAAHLLAAP